MIDFLGYFRTRADLSPVLDAALADTDLDSDAGHLSDAERDAGILNGTIPPDPLERDGHGEPPLFASFITPYM